MNWKVLGFIDMHKEMFGNFDEDFVIITYFISTIKSGTWKNRPSNKVRYLYLICAGITLCEFCLCCIKEEGLVSLFAGSINFIVLI